MEAAAVSCSPTIKSKTQRTPGKRICALYPAGLTRRVIREPEIVLTACKTA